MSEFNEDLYKRIDHEDGRVEFVPKAEKPWPQIGDMYFYVNDKGRIDSCLYSGDTVDRALIKHHNFFRTKDAVERLSKYQRLHNALFRAHEEIEPGYEFVEGRDNYVIISRDKEFTIESWCITNPITPCYSTLEKAKQALVWLKKEGVL